MKKIINILESYSNFERISKIFGIVSFAILFISVIPVLWASFYAQPIRDDFGYSAGVHYVIENGGSIFDIIFASFRTVYHTYFTWQGTYSAVFLFTIQPGVFSDRLYFLTSFIMVGSLIFSTILFFSTICKILKINKNIAYVVSSTILFLSIQFIYDKEQAFFWWNGAVYYTFFYSLSLVLFSILLRIVKQSKKSIRHVYFVISIFLALVIGGGNYSTVLCTLCILAICFMLLVKRKNKNSVYIFVVFFVMLCGLIISVVAPGNVARIDGTNGLSPVSAIIESISATAYNIINWTDIPQLIAFIFLSFFLYKASSVINYNFKYPLLVGTFSILIYATQFTPPLYTLGVIGFGRQINIYYYSYYIFVVFNIFYLCGWLNKRKILVVSSQMIKNSYVAIFTISLVIIFSIACKFYGFSNLTSIDTTRALLNSIPQRYYYEYYNISQQFNSGKKQIESKDIQTCPNFFSVLDISTDPNYWINQQIAEYYSLESVVLIE